MDLGGGVSTLTYGAYVRLARYLGLEHPKGQVGEFKVMVDIDEEILQSLGVDFRTVFIHPKDGWHPMQYPDGTFGDEWGIRYRDVGNYTEMVGHPLSNASLYDLETFSWPDLTDKSRVRNLRQKALDFYEKGYAIALGSVGGRVFEQAQWLRGMGRFLEDLALDTDFAEALLDKLVHVQIDFFNNVLEEIGDILEVVCMGDDLASQRGLLISPDMYRRLIKPRQAEVYGHVRKLTKAKVMHHSCGAVYPLIGDLIDIGVDILNPVQPLAEGMDREKLKKDFGKRICFWGGVDEQKVLPFGSVNDVAREVNTAVDSLGCGGGYVLSAAHNVQPDVSPENILAMYAACRERRVRSGL
jgi:uroporphyrinogen decarboxylase